MHQTSIVRFLQKQSCGTATDDSNHLYGVASQMNDGMDSTVVSARDAVSAAQIASAGPGEAQRVSTDEQSANTSAEHLEMLVTGRGVKRKHRLLSDIENTQESVSMTHMSGDIIRPGLEASLPQMDTVSVACDSDVGDSISVESDKTTVDDDSFDEAYSPWLKIDLNAIPTELKSTPAQKQARRKARKAQLDAWKARTAQEARAERMARRQHRVTRSDVDLSEFATLEVSKRNGCEVGGSPKTKRIRFADSIKT